MSARVWVCVRAGDILRTYDPQIGRWTTPDPYDQFASPYSAMGLDPVNNTDPSGGIVPIDPIIKTLENVTVYAMRATTTASSVSTALTVSSTMLSTFSTAGLVFLNENISSISHGLSIIPGGGEGPSSGTPRMRRANKWAKKEYGEDAKIYYSKKDGKLYLKLNIGSDYEYHPGTSGDMFNPDNSPVLSEVQIGFVKIELEESFLKQFSTWNKFKDIVNTGLDFIPIVSNFKGVVEGIVGYDLAGNKLTWDERILGGTGVYRKFKKGFKLLNAIEDAKLSKKVVDKVIESHHLLPQKFRRYFKKAGLDVDDYQIPLDVAKHRLKPGGIHTIDGGNWNKRWKEFRDANPNPKKEKILEHMNKLRAEFGI